MSKKITHFTILFLATLFLIGTGTTPISQTTNHTAYAANKKIKQNKLHKKKASKKYKIGKKYYTMKQLREKYKLYYSDNVYKKYYRSVYNAFVGRSHTVFSGTYDFLAQEAHPKHWKDQSEHWTSKKTSYYTFESVYLTRTKHSGVYWNYETHAIDAKTGHMYHYLRIGSAGGK
ncbi:hypothetical protein [Levilactobacillus enshiensis]|uniref:hypothetical protein n=1 Tax=Levilactobacillus enshiensis TaxID=2590213 RepID=UPI00117995C3|nr:hypothetical protein [Levilactobacillus enshiensis]